MHTGAYGLLVTEGGAVPDDVAVAVRPVLDEGPHLSYSLQWYVFALGGFAALAWALRDPRVTSAVIGASSVEQLDTNLDALDFPPLNEGEIAAIDKHAVDSGVNLWTKSAEIATEQE